jgi:plastocyanin
VLRVDGHGAVQIKGMNVHPDSVTVAPETTVTWTNDDAFGHTTTSNTKLWDSGVLAPGKSFSHIFDKPGNFPYHCAVHTFTTGAVTVK